MHCQPIVTYCGMAAMVLAAGATTSDRSVSLHARCPVVCPACTDAYNTCRRAGNSDNEHVRSRRRCQQGMRVNSYEGCCCDLHACQYCHLLKAGGNSNGSRGCHARQPLICIPACALSTDMACMHCRWRHAHAPTLAPSAGDLRRQPPLKRLQPAGVCPSSY
jgi:hypothetical protein